MILVSAFAGVVTGCGGSGDNAGSSTPIHEAGVSIEGGGAADGAEFESAASGGRASSSADGIAGDASSAPSVEDSAASSGGQATDALRGPGSPDASASGPTARADAATDGGPGLQADPDGGGLRPYKGVATSVCADLPTLGASWWYNWSVGSGACKTPEFVPMIWGHLGREQSPAGVASESSALVTAGYKVVLGFNEPDNTGQSNISVSTALALWPDLANPSLRVGSPATQGNAAGLAWIQNFMNQVNADATGKLRVDFIATHWYGWNAGSCDANGVNLENWIKQIEAIPGGRPIWLTEWGCLHQSNPSAATVQAFFSGAIRMLSRHPRVERYAWYPWNTNDELVAGGMLTSLGTVFAAAPTSK